MARQDFLILYFIMFAASGGCEWNNAATDFDMEVDMEVDDQTLGDVRILFLVLFTLYVAAGVDLKEIFW